MNPAALESVAFPGLGGSPYSRTCRRRARPGSPCPSSRPLGEVAVDVLSGRVEVAGVEQDRGPSRSDVALYLRHVGLGGVAAEGEHRQAEGAEPRLSWTTRPAFSTPRYRDTSCPLVRSSR